MISHSRSRISSNCDYTVVFTNGAPAGPHFEHVQLQGSNFISRGHVRAKAKLVSKDRTSIQIRFGRLMKNKLSPASVYPLNVLEGRVHVPAYDVIAQLTNDPKVISRPDDEMNPCYVDWIPTKRASHLEPSSYRSKIKSDYQIVGNI